MTIFERLAAEKIIDPTIMAVLRSYAKKWSKSEYEVLLECHIFTEKSFADTAARLFQLDRFFQIDQWPDISLLSQKIAYNEAKELEIFPYRFFGESEIEILLYDPTQSAKVQSFLQKKGFKCRFAICERREISRAIDAHYPIESQLPCLAGLGLSHV